MRTPLLPLLLLFLLSFLSANTIQAQTADEPNEGSRLLRDETTGEYTFQWWGHSGQTYFVQCSDDLINWSYVPVIETGNAAVIEYGFTCTNDHFFLRLRYTNAPTGGNPDTADFDGDGAGNLAELEAGLDPLYGIDSDADGLGDDWEILLGLDPHDGDTDLDGFGDAAEVAAGANGANPQSTPPSPVPPENSGSPDAWLIFAYQNQWVQELWTPSTGHGGIYWADMAGHIDNNPSETNAPTWAAKLGELAYPVGEWNGMPWIELTDLSSPMAFASYAVVEDGASIMVQRVRPALKASVPVTEITKRTFTPVTITTDWFTEAKSYTFGTPVTFTLAPGVNGGRMSDFSPDQGEVSELAVAENLLTVRQKVLSANRFRKNVPSYGFDDTEVMPWQSVPVKEEDPVPVASKRFVYFDVAPEIADQIEFTASSANKFSFTVLSSSGPRIPISLVGEAEGSAALFAKWKPTGKSIAILKVDVLEKATRKVSLIPVTSAAGLAPANVPAAQDVEDYLNMVWGTQANVWFTVTSQPGVTVNYDYSPADGKLEAPSNQPKSDEETSIYPLYRDQGADINVFFVKELRPAANGVSFSTTQVFIADQPVAGTQLYSIAHEVGHCLGVRDPEHNDSSKLNLMHGSPQPASPTEIRFEDWDQVERP